MSLGRTIIVNLLTFRRYGGTYKHGLLTLLLIVIASL